MKIAFSNQVTNPFVLSSSQYGRGGDIPRSPSEDSALTPTRRTKKVRFFDGVPPPEEIYSPNIEEEDDRPCVRFALSRTKVYEPQEESILTPERKAALWYSEEDIARIRCELKDEYDKWAQQQREAKAKAAQALVQTNKTGSDKSNNKGSNTKRRSITTPAAVPPMMFFAG